MRAVKWVFVVALASLALLVVAALNVLESTKLTDRITLITPRLPTLGANMLVYRDGETTIVVDSQLPILSTLVGLRVGGLDGDDHVVITHWHPDHSGGYSTFGSQASVWVHRATLDRLANDQIGHSLTAPGSIHHFSARSLNELPDNVVDSSVRLGEAEVVHFPAGHTGGDLAVFFTQERVAVLGDLVWPDSFPFVDVHTGGTVTGVLAALDAIIARLSADTIIVPGHGEPFTLAELVEYREVMASSAQTAVCAADPAAVLATWRDWESALVPLERWIEILAADPDLQCKEPERTS